jgi:hypothetical protein
MVWRTVGVKAATTTIAPVGLAVSRTCGFDPTTTKFYGVFSRRLTS